MPKSLHYWLLQSRRPFVLSSASRKNERKPLFICPRNSKHFSVQRFTSPAMLYFGSIEFSISKALLIFSSFFFFASIYQNCKNWHSANGFFFQLNLFCLWSIYISLIINKVIPFKATACWNVDNIYKSFKMILKLYRILILLHMMSIKFVSVNYRNWMTFSRRIIFFCWNVSSFDYLQHSQVGANIQKRYKQFHMRMANITTLLLQHSAKSTSYFRHFFL